LGCPVTILFYVAPADVRSSVVAGFALQSIIRTSGHLEAQPGNLDRTLCVIMSQPESRPGLNHSINVATVAMKFMENHASHSPKITGLVDIDLFHQPK
jgi:hypothetical protein